jgi:hypothetical protein
MSTLTKFFVSKFFVESHLHRMKDGIGSYITLFLYSHPHIFWEVMNIRLLTFLLSLMEFDNKRL